MKSKVLLSLVIYLMILGGFSSEDISMKEFSSYEGRVVKISDNTIFVEYDSNDSTHSIVHNQTIHKVDNIELFMIGQNLRIRADYSNAGNAVKMKEERKIVSLKANNRLNESGDQGNGPPDLWFNYKGNLILMSRGEYLWKTKTDKDDFEFFGARSVNADDYILVKSGAYFHINSESEMKLDARKVYFWLDKDVAVEIKKSNNEFQLPEKFGEYIIEVISKYTNGLVSDFIYVFAD